MIVFSTVTADDAPFSVMPRKRSKAATPLGKRFACFHLTLSRWVRVRVRYPRNHSSCWRVHPGQVPLAHNVALGRPVRQASYTDPYNHLPDIVDLARPSTLSSR